MISRTPKAARGMALLTAAFSAGAAAIHFALTPAHTEDWPLMGLGFAVVAWLQVAFAVALLVRPSRRLLIGGLALHLGALGVWALSRTYGLPIGPHAGVPEGVGLPDLAAAGLELGVVVAASVGLIRDRLPIAPVGWGRALGALAVMGLTTLVLVAPATREHTHELVAGGAAEAEHGHGDEADAGHEHGDCSEPVTAEQQAAADELVEATVAGAERYRDFETAQADGFESVTPDPRVAHYVARPYLRDGAILDPEHPESLIYAFDRQGEGHLIGVMFLNERPGTEPPSPGGCLTPWHEHLDGCLTLDGQVTGLVDEAGECPPGSFNRRTTEMLHVWLIEMPDGTFSNPGPEDMRTALIEAVRSGELES